MRSKIKPKHGARRKRGKTEKMDIKKRKIAKEKKTKKNNNKIEKR